MAKPKQRGMKPEVIRIFEELEEIKEDARKIFLDLSTEDRDNLQKAIEKATAATQED